MTTAIVLKKATKPAFLIGGLILTILGIFIASSSEMSFGKEADGSAKLVSKPARIGFGVVILICGLIIAYKGLKQTETAA